MCSCQSDYLLLCERGNLHFTTSSGDDDQRFGAVHCHAQIHCRMRGDRWGEGQQGGMTHMLPHAFGVSHTTCTCTPVVLVRVVVIVAVIVTHDQSSCTIPGCIYKWRRRGRVGEHSILLQHTSTAMRSAGQLVLRSTATPVACVKLHLHLHHATTPPPRTYLGNFPIQ